MDRLGSITGFRRAVSGSPAALNVVDIVRLHEYCANRDVGNMMDNRAGSGGLHLSITEVSR